MGRYFDSEDGLLVTVLADDVLALGPLAEGRDDIMWSYAGGVWSPDKYVVRTRVAQLLGDRYRRSHSANVEDMIRTRSAKIGCDAVPEVVNFRNGLYQWGNDTLAPHDPDIPSTVQLSVAWEPAARCPRFDGFLSQVVPADMVEMVWELIGYLLYSGNPLHKAVMLMGKGRNGKGTLLRVPGRVAR